VELLERPARVLAHESQTGENASYGYLDFVFGSTALGEEQLEVVVCGGHHAVKVTPIRVVVVVV
jgi:hypothetical protein